MFKAEVSPWRKLRVWQMLPLEEIEGMAYTQGRSHLPLEEIGGMVYMLKAEVSP